MQRAYYHGCAPIAAKRSSERMTHALIASVDPIVRRCSPGEAHEEGVTAEPGEVRKAGCDIAMSPAFNEYSVKYVKEHFTTSADGFRPFEFIRCLPPVHILSPIPPRLPALAEHHSDRMTLVLDLDETLVHCSIDPIDNPDHSFSVDFDGQEYTVHARLRPHFETFLKQASQLFEVVVFTASQSAYADRLLDILDPQRQYIHHRLFRDSCAFVHGNYLKNLQVLGRDLSRSVIVDNSVHAFGLHLENGVPIESWFDDTSDDQLIKLLPFLHHLQTFEDVRPVLRDTFRLHSFLH